MRKVIFAILILVAGAAANANQNIAMYVGEIKLMRLEEVQIMDRETFRRN